MADVHQTADGTLNPTRDGWYQARCTCGFSDGPVPDLETAVDVLMEHAHEAGRRESAS